MHNTSYILYDIIQKEGEDKLESTPIIYAPDEKLHHKLGEPILLDTEGKDIKWCEEKNSHQIEILLEEKQILEDDIKSFGKGTKWEKQLDYVRNTLAHFLNWYRNNQLDFPVYSGPTQKTIKAQFLKLFEEFYYEPPSDPAQVKRILNDKVRWKNPSQYLGIARNHFNLTVDKVKSHPGFAWIDPKGTAKD